MTVDISLVRVENLWPKRRLRLKASGCSERLRTVAPLVFAADAGAPRPLAGAVIGLLRDRSLRFRGRLIMKASVPTAVTSTITRGHKMRLCCCSICSPQLDVLFLIADSAKPESCLNLSQAAQALCQSMF